MTYRESIYKLCKGTDLTNQEDVLQLIQKLAHDCTMYFDIIDRHEKKLKKLMSYADYTQYVRDAAKEIFMNDVNGMEDSDFKEFCLEHADEITSMEV